jgi:hypothetical protein
MTLYEYIAVNNPRGASGLIASYGGRPEQHPVALSKQLAYSVYKGGQDALDKLAEIHPDRDLIAQSIQSSEPEMKSHSNACGCSSCNGYSNVDGQNSKSEVSNRINDKSELLITGGIILIAIAMVLKLAK